MATQIVTIKSFSKMFREGQEALNIHIVNVEENSFKVVSNKTIFNIGDKALFIEPDWCLSDCELFKDYLAPEGNVNKSKLGSVNGVKKRIKAIKFNNFIDEFNNSVYSYGVLIPLKEVYEYLKFKNIDVNNDSNFDELLNIHKEETEEKDKRKIGDSKGNLPSGMYKTDETNFNLTQSTLQKCLDNKETFIATVKYDGSSCTVYFKNEIEHGICSRQLEKKVFTTNYIGWKLNHFNKDESGVNHGLGYLNEKTNEFVLNKNWEEYLANNNVETKEGIANDDFVQLGYPILQKLIESKKQLAIRCEIYGQNLKGSGNKNNPYSKLPKSISVYGIDDYSTGICIPLPMNQVIDICKELDLPMVDVKFISQFDTIDELKQKCEDVFKEELIEGLVIRTLNTTNYTAKYMNLEYDSLK